MTRSFSIETARQETPGCQTKIHLNNAGAGLMPQPVFDAMTGHLLLEAEIGGYEACDQAKEQIDRFYPAAAELIGCDPEEIAYQENATRAWDMIFYSIPFDTGDRILTSEAEYASNYLAFLQMARRKGVIIEVIPNDNSGQIDLETLVEAIDNRDRVKLISLAHIPTQGGLINPAEAVGTIADSAGIFFLLDATQSIGQFPVSVQTIKCDALCATGRKYLRGPRGCGFLYLNKKHLETFDPPFIDLHSATWLDRDTYQLNNDATRFETWEVNYAAKIGLCTAIDYALHWDVAVTWERIQELASSLRNRLQELPEVTVRDLGEKQCGIVTFTHDREDPESLCKRLRQQGINTSVSWAEYARLDLDRRGLKSVLRASVHYYNTEEELEHLCSLL